MGRPGNEAAFADVWEDERSDAAASLVSGASPGPGASPGAGPGASPGPGAGPSPGPSPGSGVGIMPKKYQHYLVQALSGGNKKKLSVAVANVGRPPLLAMDECTSGDQTIISRHVTSCRITSYHVISLPTCLPLSPPPPLAMYE